MKTVELMFQTAARIIRSDGIAAITTNRIALDCGVSIGSVYQYFPNKHALLLTMAEMEMHQVADELKTAFADRTVKDDPDLELSVITALLKTLGQRHRVRRELCEFAISSGRSDIVQIPVREAYRLLGARGPASVSPLKTFVIVSAVQGVMRAAAAEDSAWLKDPSLPLELAKLVSSYRADG